MGLFHQNFDKPGPGVSPNAPRKKGAARYFEVLARDFSTFWMAGLLAMISSLPFALGLWFAVMTHSLIPMLLAGILGGMLAAPQIVGLNDTVLRAQLAGIAATHAGATGKSVDGAARDIITEAGYGPYFGHSYGHSLGLEIHEAPNCTPRNENPIPAGAVCSAEPGIYIPGKFGVRIEDVVIFREGGCEVITHSPKELTIL